MITDKIVIWGDDDKELLRSFKRYTKFVIGCSDIKIASYRLIETNSFMGENMMVFIDSDTNDFTGWNVAREFSKAEKSVYCIFVKYPPKGMDQFGEFWGSLSDFEKLFSYISEFANAETKKNQFEHFKSMENKFEQLKKSNEGGHLDVKAFKTGSFLPE